MDDDEIQVEVLPGVLLLGKVIDKFGRELHAPVCAPAQAWKITFLNTTEKVVKYVWVTLVVGDNAVNDPVRGRLSSSGSPSLT